MELLQYTTPRGGSGQWNSFWSLPHCLGVVGSAGPMVQCRIASGQWAVELLRHTIALPRYSG